MNQFFCRDISVARNSRADGNAAAVAPLVRRERMSPQCSSGLERRVWNSGEIFTGEACRQRSRETLGSESRSVVTSDASGAAERLGRGFWQLLFIVFSYLFIFFLF